MYSFLFRAGLPKATRARREIESYRTLLIQNLKIRMYLSTDLLQSHYVSFCLVQLVLFLPIAFFLWVCVFRHSAGSNLFFLFFCSSNDILEEEPGKKMFLYCQFGWGLYVLHFIYSTHGWYGVWNPFVYGFITASALVLGGGFIFEILHRIRSGEKPSKTQTNFFQPRRLKLNKNV